MWRGLSSHNILVLDDSAIFTSTEEVVLFSSVLLCSVFSRTTHKLSNRFSQKSVKRRSRKERFDFGMVTRITLGGVRVARGHSLVGDGGCSKCNRFVLVPILSIRKISSTSDHTSQLLELYPVHKHQTASIASVLRCHLA